VSLEMNSMFYVGQWNRTETNGLAT